MRTHLFIYPGGQVPPSFPAHVTASGLPAEPSQAARVIEETVGDSQIEILVFWDSRLGPVPWPAVSRFEAALDDVWHSGSRLTGPDGADLLAYVQPLSVYRPDPDPDLQGAVSWRLDLRAAFVRAVAVRRLGTLERGFDSLGGAALELGYRFIRRGAICRQQPDLVPPGSVSGHDISLADRYRLLRRYFSSKWTGYAFARRLMQADAPIAELRAWRASARGAGRVPSAPTGALLRPIDHVRLPERVSVSVVLPTFGRYRYVAEVLEDLRAQTIKPTQILIADGNPPGERQPDVYERFADLPIEVLWHEVPGICSGRNACLRRVTGDYVWFVDDDSRFAPDNLEAHLRVLAAYGADVSVGPAYTPSRPELLSDQREVVCTHMDCGTTLCRQSLIQKVGGFDMEFNEYLAGEDGELGIRFVRSGGLMVNNPLAKRFHYVAPVGGSRTSKRSVHRFTRWSLMPRPVQSIYYTAKRYFEPSAARDAMVQSAVLYGWRRKEGVPATRRWRLQTLFGEIAAIPITLLRLRRSVQLGREMVAQGPMIASLAKTDASAPLHRTEGDSLS